MRFSLHGGSAEEVATLKELARRLGARFEAYKGLPGEEPLLVAQCFPRGTNLMEVIEQVTRWLDRDPLPGKRGGEQDPLPGLETPPCR